MAKAGESSPHLYLPIILSNKLRRITIKQDKKDVIAAEELKQKEKEWNNFIVGFALVMALFIFRSYRQKQKDNIIITNQNIW